MAAGTFEGTSSKGDINEAIWNAAQEAKTGLSTDLVSWTLEKVTGQNGGFTRLNDITVTINAEAGPPQEIAS